MWEEVLQRGLKQNQPKVLGSEAHLSKVDNAVDILDASWKNSDRSICAVTFQKYTTTFKLIDSDESPQECTVVIDADIRHALMQKPKHQKIKR